MKQLSISERLLIEEVTEAASKLQLAIRGMEIGQLIRQIRIGLGMSQKILARRANVPQSTVSRIEQGQRDLNLSTLIKILSALSCDLVIAPLLKEPIASIRKKQARIIAKKHVEYLQGTMYLEDQKPDERFLNELIHEEEENFLRDHDSKLWEDKD